MFKMTSYGWDLKKQRKFEREMKIVSSEFVFKDRDPETIIFSDAYRVAELNYETGELKNVYVF